MPDLVSTTDDENVRARVSQRYGQAFTDLINDISARVPISRSETGGYSPRTIAGTHIPSRHAYGEAVDINWAQNPEGKHNTQITSYFTPDELRDIAASHNMRWLGDRSGPRGADNMHFEMLRGAPAAPLGSPSVRAPASARPEATTDVGAQPVNQLHLLAGYRGPTPTPFTQPPEPGSSPPPAVASAAPFAASPPPAAGAPAGAVPEPSKPTPAVAKSPFAPSSSSDDGLAMAAMGARARAQKLASMGSNPLLKPWQGLING